MSSTKTWPGGEPLAPGLAAHDHEFLAGTGLKVGQFGYLRVHPTFETVPNGVVLAYDSDVAICCTPSGVVATEGDHERFVSSSAEHFAASMYRMARYVDEVQATEDEDAALAVVHTTIADLRGIDPAAWSSERSYWPVIAEQMIAGML